MATGDEIARIEQAVRDASFRPSCWQEVLSSLSSLFGCEVAILGIVDADQRALIHVEQSGLEDRARSIWTAYRAGVWNNDYHARMLSAIEQPLVYSEQAYSLAALPVTDPYVTWLDHSGVFHHLSYAVCEGNLVASIGIYKAREAGPFTSDEQRRMSAIGAKVDYALCVVLKQMTVALQSYWDGLTSHGSREACLLDGLGRIVRTTESFEARLTAKALIRAAGQQLHANEPKDDVKLQQALADVLSRRARGRSYVALAGGKQGSAIIEMKSVGAPTASLLHDQARILVTISSPDTSVDTPEALVRELFGATPQEARVAVGLVRGETLASIAGQLQVSRETVRVHLKRLFVKTDTNRQAQLVRLIGMLSVRH